jgi:hypothetical protein
MKQLDLIVAASALVIGIVASWIVWATKKNPEFAPQAKSIPLTAPALPTVQIAKTSGLPGGATGAGGNGMRTGRGKGGFRA